ncbi:MAG: helix-hairpin-helix domain-containing protein [Culturomica sp.]|jgi:hypothetical protein|nr:helix-hairpin-helix domain-containing protein [Culturomica sp.]
MKRILLLLIFWANALPLISQELNDVERLLEGLSELYSEDEYEDIVNTLTQLHATPLNVNSADFNDLKKLFFLSDTQIDNILEFRRRNGRFLHFRELTLVNGVSSSDLEKISPFIIIGDGKGSEHFKSSHSAPFHEYIQRVSTKLPQQQGYKTENKDSRFEGAPFGVLVKYKMKARSRWQIGLTLENDAGESYFTRHQRYGFDFLSAHVAFTGRKRVKRLVVGDFRSQMGQGLVMWSGFSSGKSSLVVSNEKSANTVAPSTSTDENRFLRGVAASVVLNRNLTVNSFFSSKKTDGNVNLPDSLSEEDMITATVYESGYHRNRKECEKKHRLRELTLGGSLEWNTMYFKLGFNGIYYNFTPSITRSGNIYNKYDDDGRRRFLGSVDYKIGVHNLYFFGETAVSDNGSIATVNGLRFNGSGKLAMSVLYRRYDKRYISRYASGFAEYSNTTNEEGIYVGLNLNLARDLNFNFYYDRFRFFAPRYGAFLPDNGYEFLTEMVYAKKDKFSHSLRYKREVKPENHKNRVVESTDRVKDNLKYIMTYHVSGRFATNVGVSFTHYKKAEVNENGMMLYNDWVYTSVSTDFKVQCRFAYFDTDSYQSRIYAYENNVLYGYSFPAAYGKGVRAYMNSRLKCGKRFTFYAKFGVFYYPDRATIGSGLSQVDGNKTYDLSLQIRIRL